MSDLQTELQRLIEECKEALDAWADINIFTTASELAAARLDKALTDLADFILAHRAALVVLAPDERVVVPLAYGWHETAYNPKDVGQWIKVSRIDNPHWIVHTNEAAPRPDGDV